jgi:hypothetical protein
MCAWPVHFMNTTSHTSSGAVARASKMPRINGRRRRDQLPGEPQTRHHVRSDAVTRRLWFGSSHPAAGLKPKMALGENSMAPKACTPNACQAGFLVSATRSISNRHRTTEIHPSVRDASPNPGFRSPRLEPRRLRLHWPTSRRTRAGVRQLATMAIVGSQVTKSIPVRHRESFRNTLKDCAQLEGMF